MLLIEALSHQSMNPVTVIGPSSLSKDEIGKKYRWYGGKIQARSKVNPNWRNIATLKVDILCNGIVDDNEVL